MILKAIGTLCRRYRRQHNISVKSIAERAKYSIWMVYKFEQGETNNAVILLAYMSYGFKLKEDRLCQALQIY